MPRALAPAALALLLVGACASPDAPTAPPVVRGGPAATTALTPTHTAIVVIGFAYEEATYTVSGVEALYHESPNNQWLKFMPTQPAGVSVDGAGRVQYLADQGTVLADGILIALVPGLGELQLDLAQLEALQTSPFVQIGPGGGCLELTGVLYTAQHPGGVNVSVRIDFSTQMLEQ